MNFKWQILWRYIFFSYDYGDVLLNYTNESKVKEVTSKCSKDKCCLSLFGLNGVDENQVITLFLKIIDSFDYLTKFYLSIDI